ncbi:cupin domain-containing protein [Fundidesulfovibrio terrae]|uniref:cupin domain-containing protein n=1 Tax=Fundidesulfovibrio terrae TaxID=2922866 RepID=UPI001FAF45A4|nr:cupin domain-containing protein [Fundidesulfovibrio terrae]
MNDAGKLFEAATVILGDRTLSAGNQEWNPHPVFEGVWMKNLMLGKDTGGRLSCHLVRIGARRAIGDHTHDGSLELHEVLSGRGVCRMPGREADYGPGVCMAIEAGVRHAVEARDEDLYLLAKFTPALA